MKTIAKKISALILLIVMLLTVFSAGCTFIDPNIFNNGGGTIGGSTGGGSNQETETPPKDETLNNNTEDVEVDLKNFTDDYGGVTYVGKSHEEPPYGSVAETIEKTKVNYSSVAIFITVQSGTICGSGVIVDIDDGVNNGSLEDNIFYVVTCNHVVSVCENENANVSVYVPDSMGRNYDDVGYNDKYNILSDTFNISLKKCIIPITYGGF